MMVLYCIILTLDYARAQDNSIYEDAMPRFLVVNQYQPSDYSLDDYRIYQALANPTALFDRHISSSSASSKNTPTITALHTVLNKILDQIRAFRNPTLADYLPVYLEKIDGFQRAKDFTNLYRYLDLVNFNGYDPRLISLHNSLKSAVMLIHDIPQGEERDPDELGPVAKSLEYLDKAWFSVTGHAIDYDNWRRELSSQGTPKTLVDELSTHSYATQEIVEAHIANLQMVFNPGYAEDCKKEFLEGASGVMAKIQTQTPLNLNSSSHQPPVQPIRAGLLLRIYQDPQFSHWLTQLILLSIVIAAAMATTAVILPTLLPVAIAALVKGLSTLATRTILGAAITVGVLATATLATSLHARFFYHPPETGSGQQPQSSNTIEHR